MRKASVVALLLALAGGIVLGLHLNPTPEPAIVEIIQVVEVEVAPTPGPTVTFTVELPVNQMHGELIYASLAGMPIVTCAFLVNTFGLYLPFDAPITGYVPCHVVIEIVE